MNMIKKVWNIKTFYILCFLAINLIEWVKGTQWNGWRIVADHSTGPVLMAMVISAYPLKEFCTKNNLIYSLCCVLAVPFIWICGMQKGGIYTAIAYLLVVVNIWLIGIVLLTLLKRKREGVFQLKKPGAVCILWILFTVCAAVSVCERRFICWFLFLFALFYLTDFKERWTALIDGMVNGTLLSFFLLQVYAFGFRPYDEVRYKGAFSNCNMTALYFLVIYCMVLVKLHFAVLKKASFIKQLFWIIALGGLLALQILTICRTAWICAVIITGVYGVSIMRRIWKDTWLKILGKGVILALCVVLEFPALYASVRWLPTILHRPVWYEGEYAVSKVHSFDPADSEKYVSLEEFMDAALRRIWQILHVAETENPLVLQAYATEKADTPVSAQDSSNSVLIRSEIYKIYLKNMNFRGHTTGEGYYQITPTYHAWHAQNLWIQAAYDYGVIAGIVLIAMTGMLLYRLFRGFYRNQISVRYGVIPLVITVLFFTFGVTEVVWQQGQLILFLVFFTQHPAFLQPECCDMDQMR